MSSSKFVRSHYVRYQISGLNVSKVNVFSHQRGRQIAKTQSTTFEKPNRSDISIKLNACISQKLGYLIHV
jgi:hypothetical protein